MVAARKKLWQHGLKPIFVTMKISCLRAFQVFATVLNFPCSGRAELNELPLKLLEEVPPPLDWRVFIEARIKAGEPLPELPAPPTPLSEKNIRAELLAYWRDDWPWRQGEKPTQAVRAKILEAIKAEPSAIPEVLQALPRSEAAAKTILGLIKEIPGTSDINQEDRRKVRAWIFRESGLLQEQILVDAWRANWEIYLWEGYSDPTLESLQKRAPKEARRLFEKFTLGDDPGLKVAGAHLLLEMSKPDDGARWRKILISAAGNPTLPKKVRELAIHSLISTDWSGREEWIIASLGQEDPGEMNWFTKAIEKDPDHWVPLLAGFVENKNRYLHDHAVYLLAQFHLGAARADALRPLLPWLKNENWSSAGRMERLRLIQSCAAVNLPGAVDGLREIILNDQDDTNLAYASEALVHYQVKEAIPELKEAVKRCSNIYKREMMMKSIYLLGGYSIDEILSGLAACYRAMPTSRGRYADRALFEEGKISLEAHLGLSLVRRMSSTFDDEVLKAIVEQIGKLGGDEPIVVRNLRELVASISSKVSQEFLAESLLNGSLSHQESLLAFDRIREKSWSGEPFRVLVGQPGVRGGFAAVFARDEAALAQVMRGDDSASKSALMAAARLTRDSIPLSSVAALLASKQEALVATTTAFLQSSNDPKAHVLLRKHQPDLTAIGESDRGDDPGYFNFRSLRDLEGQVRKQFPERDNLVEAFGLLSYGTWGGRGHWYVFVYPDHALAVRDFDWGRFGICRLRREQLAKVRAYVEKFRIDELPPLELPIDDGIQMTYVHATQTGVRRVFMNNPPTSRASVEKYSKDNGRGIVIYAQLANLFTDLFEELDLKLQYGTDIEILVPREKAHVESVWKEGGDLRILVRNSQKVSHWQGVDPSTGKLLGPVEEPPGFEIIDARAHLHPAFDIQSDYHFRYPWQIRSGDALVHPGKFDEQVGLWLCRRNKEPELLAEGIFLSQLVSLDGKWCVAAHASGSGWAEPNTAVRINLETKEVMPINLKPADNFDTEAFIPAHGKFLITRRADHYPGDSKPVGPEKLEAHLLDAATGELQRVEGDFSPFDRGRFRPLQETGVDHVSWITKTVEGPDRSGMTEVGRYDSKRFRFEAVRGIEEISFDSHAMWVDEINRTIYAAVNGDLVRVPLVKE